MTFRASVQPLITGCRAARNRFFNLIDPPIVVLIYHRVNRLASDPQQLVVSPENFRAQMRHIRDRYPIVRFEESWGDVSSPSVAVTFDDGYADNLHFALPILEEEGVPATFFVSTGNIGTGNEFWWDELERILLGERSFPECLVLDEEGLDRPMPTSSLEERLRLYRELQPTLLRLDPCARERFLSKLRAWAGLEEEGREEYRSLTLSELGALAASSWVTIGAHTVSHTALSAIPVASQREEIVESRRQLESWIGRKTYVFSYPFGARGDYTRDSVKICRDAGFTRVAANFPGQAHRWTDPMQIPRQLVRNWPVEEFAERLKGYLVL